ncbi:FbpB family small basic protein [Priestia koreensis]|nr:FbpB family small basic protein [Priestia koreensis]MCM3006170.1 FbpB family small basic protein [Priestia koreensis]
MRKLRKRSFSELVQENKRQLLRDHEALNQLEERLEQRLALRMLEQAE